MNYTVFPNAQTACKAAIQNILNQAKSESIFRIALPTGNTMIPFYSEFVPALKSLDLSNWVFFPVDEYVDEYMDENPVVSAVHKYLYFPNDPRSFFQFLNKHFFDHLKDKNFRRYTWHQDEAEIKNELSKVSLNSTVLGVGLNGHLAFNEPGSDFNSGIRNVKLSEQTIRRNFGLNPSQKPPSHAITLGLREITASQNIHVLAFGESKAPIIHEVFKSPVQPELPATVLQGCPNARWYLDFASAKQIQSK